MSLTDELVLPEDVRVIPVAQLAAAVRAEIGNSDGFAITRPLGRSTSSVVGPEVAELLGEFRSPSTVAAAVIRYSRRNSLDPEQTLDEAYPALRQCVGEGYLVPSGSAASQRVEASLRPGDEFGGHTVVRLLHLLDDTELHQVRSPDGVIAAAKIARGTGADVPPKVRETFAREAAALRLLTDTSAPELLHDGSDEDRPWLLLEWCEGAPATAAARADRVAVFRAILAAYAAVHARGVLHGDVHPGNVLVDASGRVRIIDYGLCAGADLPSIAPRGGLPAFFEPEFAVAVLGHRPPPPVTAAGEVHALAALGHLLITGKPYLELGLDSTEALRRLATSPPLPFSRQGAQARPALEAVLRAALDKDPLRRPGSVRRFAELVATAVDEDAAAGHGTATLLDAAAAQILSDLIPGGDLHRTGPAAPRSSVTYGAAGIAAALLRIAALRGDPDLLVAADDWAERALRAADDPDAFTEPAIGIDAETIGAVTPYHRVSGVHLVRALVGHAAGNVIARQSGIDGFVAASAAACDNLDVTVGRSGTLLGAALLLEACQGAPYVTTDGLQALGSATLAEIWSVLDGVGDVASSPQLAHLGVAHGWAGVLLATLRWCDVLHAAPPERLVDRLEQLAAVAEPTAAGVRWPWTNPTGAGSRLSVPGWCNGTAGHTLLWVQAHRSLGDDRWLTLAERAGAETAAAHGGVAQLCCGSAGQAYALLELHRHTGERGWLDAAREQGTAAAEALGGRDLIRGSLFKGEVGVAVLAADLANPELAAMPVFGREGW